MANEIKALDSSVNTASIDLNSLATSTTQVGVQSDAIDNSTTRYQRLHNTWKIKQGTTPTGNKAAYQYFIRSNKDTTPVLDDGAGTTKGAWTRYSAQNYDAFGAPMVIPNKPSPATGDLLQRTWVIDFPGYQFAHGVSHDTAVNTDSTAGNHSLTWRGENPEVQ